MFFKFTVVILWCHQIFAINNFTTQQKELVRASVNCLSFITQNDCKKGTILIRDDDGCLTCKGGLGESHFFFSYFRMT